MLRDKRLDDRRQVLLVGDLQAFLDMRRDDERGERRVQTLMDIVPAAWFSMKNSARRILPRS